MDAESGFIRYVDPLMSLARSSLAIRMISIAQPLKNKDFSYFFETSSYSRIQAARTRFLVLKQLAYILRNLDVDLYTEL